MNKKLWRTRVVVESEAVIEPGNVQLRDANIYASKIDESNFLNGDSIPPTLILIDALFPRNNENGDAYSAYLYSHDIIDELLDRLSLVGYGRTRLCSYISTTYNQVSVGEKFPLVTKQCLVKKEFNPIKIEDISFSNSYEVNSGVKQALNFLRKGLTTNSDEEKLLMYFTALERLANEETTDTVKQTCQATCKEKFDTGRKATGNYIRSMLNEYGIPKKEFETIRTLRNKIAHGAGKRNVKYMEDVVQGAARIEMVAMQELSKRVNSPLRNRIGVLLTGLPAFIHQFKAMENGTFDRLSSQWKAPLLYPKLDRIEGFENDANSAYAGCPLDTNSNPIIDPMSWPDIVE